MMEITPFPVLQAAGVRQHHEQAAAPDPVTSEWLAGQIATSERILRLQYEGGGLPAEWEGELASLAGEDITSRLQRWAYLKHLWRVRWQRMTAAAEPSAAEAQAVARQILRREPVVVWLGRHRIEVTSRSYSAMAEIAVHELTCRRLAEDIKQIVDLTSVLESRVKLLSVLDRAGRNRFRRRLAKLASLYQRAYTERELHRVHIYAHALTRHGGPATDVVQEAPAWWREMGAEDDAALFLALYRVGPLRYEQLGQAPLPSADSRATFREDFGFASLFSAWEKELGLQPAELFDRDLAQVLTQMRAGAFELPEPAHSPSKN